MLIDSLEIGYGWCCLLGTLGSLQASARKICSALQNMDKTSIELLKEVSYDWKIYWKS